MTTSQRDTQIIAPTGLPMIIIIRDFDAPPSAVFRAWTEPELFAQWNGPRSIETRIQQWDARTGGCWQYTAWRENEQVASFYGSFHEIRPNERVVQTFTFEGVPDGVSLDTASFQALPDGGTRVTITSVTDSLENRNAALSSGMDVGVREGFEKLDEHLSRKR